MYKVNFQFLHVPPFSVVLTELSQQSNQLLSQLNAGIDPTAFGSWANNNPNCWANPSFQLCILKKCYDCSLKKFVGIDTIFKLTFLDIRMVLKLYQNKSLNHDAFHIFKLLISKYIIYICNMLWYLRYDYFDVFYIFLSIWTIYWKKLKFLKIYFLFQRNSNTYHEWDTGVISTLKKKKKKKY